LPAGRRKNENVVYEGNVAQAQLGNRRIERMEKKPPINGLSQLASSIRWLMET